MKAKRYIQKMSDLANQHCSVMLLFIRDIMPAVKRNKEREKMHSAYDPSLFTR